MPRFFDFAVSPLDTRIEIEGEVTELWRVEGRDLARGFCGALFLALPLLYTLEMWERSRVIPSWDLAIIVVLTYFANVGYNKFSGFKPQERRKSPWLDACVAMGLGLVASWVTVVLIGRHTFATPSEIGVKLLLLEMVPASFGASLAINQLGARKEGGKKSVGMSPDLRKVVGSLLGAAMFAFNVAPTIEPQVITFTASWWHTLGLVLFSLFVSYVMVFLACFVQRDDEGGVLRARSTETAVAYLISLAVSASLLWMFGYLDTGTPLPVAVPWVVTLGYATTLGGSAGRLIL